MSGQLSSLGAAFFLLGSFGLAYIVGHSSVSMPIRRWLGGVPGDDARSSVPGALGPFGDFVCSLVECPACFGFWTGVASALTLLEQDGSVLGQAFWALSVGCVVAGSNFILGRVTRLI